MKLRMRTKFLLSMLLISAGLTCTTLLLVRSSVRSQVKKEIFSDLENSVSTFESFQRQREVTLSRSADLLADLPNLRALMTTEHEATIQDGSNPLARLAGSDIFVLANRTGHVVALHTTKPGFTREMAQQSLDSSIGKQSSEWWYGDQHLYQVFLKPIYFGPAEDDRLLGFLVIGYEIDDGVAAEVSRIAASQVAFFYDNKVVKSTLAPAHEAELAQFAMNGPSTTLATPEEVQLGDERFLGTSVELGATKTRSVRLSVLKSYDQATAFLDNLNRLLLALGVVTMAAGSLLVFFISHTFTRPLGSLVAGVRALGKGDFTYDLDERGGDEVAEVTAAFNRMRASLLKTQQELLEAERLATIGRMASSISHDLRHSLAAIVANAEFLCEARLSSEQREDLYQEVRLAVNQMTELIDSLLEFSRTRESLRPSYGSVKEVAERVVHSIRSRPDFRPIEITVTQAGSGTGWFDARKLERAFYNLILNACEAITNENGSVQVEIREVHEGVEIRIADNGRGIPDSIRATLFEPFTSWGKENGTGLGLAVVQKIIQDHGGDAIVEKTSSAGTVFLVTLPLISSSVTDAGGARIGLPAPARPKPVPSD